MTISFEKAPLVEIIAELRWDQPYLVQDRPPGAVQIPISLVGSSKLEEFFMRFGGECYQLGFQRSERIVPAGFPIVPFQPVYRYKRADTTSTALFQVGAGLFSANAIPPYKSWNEFSPIVSEGIMALLKTRDDAEKEFPFTGVSLRYIDAFSDDLLAGMTADRFINEVLGFSVSLPPAISGLLPPNQAATSFIQLRVPTRAGLLTAINIGEGTVNGSHAVIMDTTVSATTEVRPRIDVVMEALNSARAVIHDMFVSITQPIHKQMNPTGA